MVFSKLVTCSCFCSASSHECNHKYLSCPEKSDPLLILLKSFRQLFTGKRSFVLILVLGFCTGLSNWQCQFVGFIKTNCYTKQVVLMCKMSIACV